MVSLPLFKFAALFLKHVSKYGANWIKSQAHDHPKFRIHAARYGQSMHQINMRMAVTLLQNSTAENLSRERKENTSAKAEKQSPQDDAIKEKTSIREKTISTWKRKFRPLPEGRAVDLFADVIGDAFILMVAGGLILYEYVRAKGRPDLNAEKIAELQLKLEDLDRREVDLERAEKTAQSRVDALELTLTQLKNKGYKTCSPRHCGRGMIGPQSLPYFCLNQILYGKVKKPCNTHLNHLNMLEIPFETYDLAIPINIASNSNPTDYFRLIILSPADINKSLDTQDRVENLYHKWGGKNVGILFLLNESNQDNGSLAMMSLQARQVKTLKPIKGLTKFMTSLFSNVEMPILPLFNVKSLQSTISSFLQHIEHPLIPTKYNTSATSLLPYCSTNPPMHEHARNIISDICVNISELGILMSTDQGHQMLSDLLSDYPRSLQEITDFWQEEDFTE